MAVTIPTTWERVNGDEIRAGQLISEGLQANVLGITQGLNRQWAYNVRSHSAVLSSPRGIPGITSGGFTTIAQGKIRVWDQDARMRLRVYGGYVRTRVIIGGAVAIQVDNAAAGPNWVNNHALITAATIAADGLCDILIEAIAPFGGNPAALFHVVLEETENSGALGVLPPDGSQARTQFVSLDDGAAVDDLPYDVWLAQQWDDDRLALRGPLRSRGVCHLYPETRPHRLSSAFWRCDGPYIVPSQPWADRLRVTVTTSMGSGESGQMFVFSDSERADEVRDDRVVSLTSSLTHSTFEVTLRPGDNGVTLVWIAFKTNPGSTTALTPELGDIEPRRALVYCEEVPDAWAPMPDDKVMLFGSDVGHAGSKGGTSDWSFQPPAAVADIAAIPGSDGLLGGGTRIKERLIISPHPDTGYVDTSSMRSVYDPVTLAQTYKADFEVFNLDRIALHGVLIEATGPDETRERAAKYEALPASGVPQRVLSTINTHATYGTPVLCARHPGERNILGDTGSVATQVLHEGHWAFVPGSNFTPGAYDIDIPFPVDPSYGAGSGIVPERIIARIVYMIVPMRVVGVSREAEISIQLRQGASAGGDVYEHIQMQWLQGSSPSRGMTVYDAAGAASTVAVDPTALAPFEHVEHAYTQQYTDPDDATQGGPWTVSREAAILTSVLGAFPQILTLRIKNRGLPDSITSDTMLIVAGLTCYVGPRI